MKRLEAYLGTTLFHRGHRSVELTDQGQELAASLGDLFQQLDQALERASARTAKVLRVSTIESFAAKWLAPRLHRFQREHADITIRVETSNAPVDFVRDSVDIAIRYGPGGSTGVVAERLMDAPVFPVCAASLRGDAGQRLSAPDDLRHFTLLHDESSAGHPGVPDWRAWLQASGAAQVDASRGPVFASIYLAQEAALARHGVALGVAPLVDEDLRQGRLIQPLEGLLPNAYAFWIVRQPNANPHPAIDAFCRWLREEALASRPAQPASAGGRKRSGSDSRNG